MADHGWKKLPLYSFENPQQALESSLKMYSVASMQSVFHFDWNFHL